MWIAITRDVSADLSSCELTHLQRQPIDLARARQEHEAYRMALAGLGCVVVTLPELHDHPDAVFVEDAAVVLDELAVLTRPGAESRRAEVDAIASALEPLRPLARLAAPATLDGGDVARVGRTLFVGRSTRTNAAGVESLSALVQPHGYTVVPVTVHAALHLKSACCPIGRDAVLAHRPWFDPAPLLDAGVEIVDVPTHEASGCNVLVLGSHALVSSAAQGTGKLLARRGLSVEFLDNDELRKAEAGLTCCSLLLSDQD